MVGYADRCFSSAHDRRFQTQYTTQQLTYIRGTVVNQSTSSHTFPNPPPSPRGYHLTKRLFSKSTPRRRSTAVSQTYMRDTAQPRRQHGAFREVHAAYRRYFVLRLSSFTVAVRVRRQYGEAILSSWSCTLAKTVTCERFSRTMPG
jgi:hypothetical protein